MVSGIAERLDLGPNEFAFHFETDDGIEARVLATFLQRAATVAKRHGADLRIVGLREGSLDVIIAPRKSGIAQNAAKEFREKPIGTTVAVAGLVTAIVGAIIAAMALEKNGASPMGKAGAELVERHEVTQIEIVTTETSTVLMNKEIAQRVREAPRHGGLPHTPPEAGAERRPPQVLKLAEDARQGDLSGEVLLVEGNLHFRPDGHKFLVPVDKMASHGIRQLSPGGHYRVTGQIEMLSGQPDSIIIDSAVPLRH
jgi:hypothetical protein